MYNKDHLRIWQKYDIDLRMEVQGFASKIKIKTSSFNLTVKIHLMLWHNLWDHFYESCVSFLTFKGWSGPTSLTRLSDFGEGSSVERQNYAERTNKRPLGTHPTHTINLIDATDALRNFAHHSRNLIKLVNVRRLDVPGFAVYQSNSIFNRNSSKKFHLKTLYR